MGMAEWSDDNDEATQTAMEVGTLAGAAMLTSAGFGALAAHSHAKDPKNGGMPGLGPIGADAIAGTAALLGAVFLGETLGSAGQTALLGVGLGGLCSASNGWGSAFGVWLAKPAAATTGAMGSGSAQLNPEAQQVYNQYMGK